MPLEDTLARMRRDRTSAGEPEPPVHLLVGTYDGPNPLKRGLWAGFACDMGGERGVRARYAVQARATAERMREHARRHGHDTTAVDAEAAGVERYAAACEIAAADPTLPAPEYLPEEIA